MGNRGIWIYVVATVFFFSGCSTMPRDGGESYDQSLPGRSMATLSSDHAKLVQEAEAGDQQAFIQLFDQLLFRAGSDANIQEAKKYADLARKLRLDSDEFLIGSLETIELCYEAGVPNIPQSERPTESEISLFRENKTNCLAFKEGIGAPQSWSQYRKCVLSQDYVDNNRLAEIYANGWGVARNPTLAIALSCHASQVPAELHGIVRYLDSTRSRKRLEPPYAFCDHVTSGLSGGICAAMANEVAELRHEHELAQMTQVWSFQEKAAFENLRTSVREYIQAHSRNELDMSGTARAQLALDEERKLMDEFYNSIKDFESSQFPHDANLQMTEAELKTLLPQFTKKALGQSSTITKEGIKTTQTKWEEYVKSFLSFAKLRYPGVSPDIFKTWLTRQRIDLLKEF